MARQGIVGFSWGVGVKLSLALVLYVPPAGGVTCLLLPLLGGTIVGMVGCGVGVGIGGAGVQGRDMEVESVCVGRRGELLGIRILRSPILKHNDLSL